MAYFANQKTITIHKPQIEKDATKIILDRKVVEAAARELTGNEFKMYMYFASNSDNFDLDFSPSHFGNTYGITADTARKIVKKLEEKKYLIRRGRSENLFDFYLSPQKKLHLTIKVEKRYIEDESGARYPMSFGEFSKAALEDGEFTEDELKAYWSQQELVEEEK